MTDDSPKRTKKNSQQSSDVSRISHNRDHSSSRDHSDPRDHLNHGRRPESRSPVRRSIYERARTDSPLLQNDSRRIVEESVQFQGWQQDYERPIDHNRSSEGRERGNVDTEWDPNRNNSWSLNY